MSRPIYEPSPPRADAELGYGSRQLFRRPAPVSGGGLEPTVVLGEGATTAPDNTWMPIPFSDLAYNPTLVTQGDIFDWTITDTGDTGNDRFEITTLVEGWYEYELMTVWDQVATGGTDEFGYAVQRLTWDSLIGFPFDDNDIRHSADWFDSDLHSTFEMVDNPWLQGMGRVYVPNNRIWLPTAKQRTGVDRGLSGIYFRIAFKGADDISTWAFEFV